MRRCFAPETPGQSFVLNTLAVRMRVCRQRLRAKAMQAVAVMRDMAVYQRCNRKGGNGPPQIHVPTRLRGSACTSARGCRWIFCVFNHL